MLDWVRARRGPRAPTICSQLQDSSGSSAACWWVLSLQLVSGGRSSQCAPVGPSSARWNDKRNDMPTTQPSSVGGLGRADASGAVARWHYRAEPQRLHRPTARQRRGPDQGVDRAGAATPPPITPAPLLLGAWHELPTPSHPSIGCSSRCHTAGQPLASSHHESFDADPDRWRQDHQKGDRIRWPSSQP
jgi:hypothetical protein